MDLLARLKAQPLPFAALLGIDLRSAEPEKIVGEMTVRPEFCTRPAVLHGGAIMAFADTLGALATIANLKDGAGTTTIESKTNFIAAATVGRSGPKKYGGGFPAGALNSHGWPGAGGSPCLAVRIPIAV